MKKTKLMIEVDFPQVRKVPCANCGHPFEEHFQPGADADPMLAANWCPCGSGFTSREFKLSKSALGTVQCP